MTTTREKLALGLHYHRAGRLAEAEGLYWEVLTADPDDADARHLMGVLAHQIGRDDVAIGYIESALALKPDRPDFHSNLAEACRALGRYADAAVHFQQALLLEPDFADAHNNYGLLLQAQGQQDEAIGHYQRALELVPDFPEAHNNLGNVFKEQRRLDEAVVQYRTALALQPAFADAHVNLADTMMEQGLRDQAVAHFRQALAFRPDFPVARFGLCMAQLSVLYRTEGEIDERRAAYRQSLLELRDAVIAAPAAFAPAVGSHQPFFLAYQGRNDRELQAIYGELVVRAMAARTPAAPRPVPVPVPPADPRRRLRIGIVSGYFFNHSAWKMPIKGWLTQLDRERFELFCYHTRLLRDAETDIAEQIADSFVQGPLPLDEWCAVILADAPDVLIYPEIGMDPMTVQLAAQRLARVQCTSWGHPETCGLPTIDYYLSSALMEPPDADRHYTETLVRLPNLSVYYEPPPIPALTVTRAEFGLRPDAVVYWCCQSLFKYLPQDDQVFPRIAAAVGNCQFVFLGYQGGPHVVSLFQERLTATFAAAGARAEDHCVFLPRLDPERFIAVGGLCDVYLDSIGWSGINTTLEAGLTDLPVVTLPGALLRGRHSLAVLRMMGVTETIAETVDDYVALAVRLGTDVEWRAAIRRKMAAGRARVYRDDDCVAGLETFLVGAVTG
jgi:predicted O-linked N-acetylglucosamine transferase (SPINDLY family)